MTGPAVALMGTLELGGDDVGEAGLADAGGPEEQDVVEGLAAAARGFDGDAEVGDDLGAGRRTRRGAAGAADWSKPGVVVDRAAGDEAGIGHGLA